MGLYNNVQRIEADLLAIGIGPDDPVTVDDLTPFDQYHYEGTAAVDAAAQRLGLGPNDTVLDIGSGLGGPARYLADRWGCAVTALEIQGDLHSTGARLTTRAGLSHRVTHVHGNVLTGIAGSGRFTAAISMLCFLHIPNRAALFARCAAALQPGATLLIDDYFARAPLTSTEIDALATKVQCPYLPDRDTYVTELTGAGFGEPEIIDKTAAWAAFVADRYADFRTATPTLTARYGEATVASLDGFYRTVARLFAAGRVGGARFVATRPAELELSA